MLRRVLLITKNRAQHCKCNVLKNEIERLIRAGIIALSLILDSCSDFKEFLEDEPQAMQEMSNLGSVVQNK